MPLTPVTEEVTNRLAPGKLVKRDQVKGGIHRQAVR
jgi:hypothetical protein